jgi:hypothetical protein
MIFVLSQRHTLLRKDEGRSRLWQRIGNPAVCEWVTTCRTTHYNTSSVTESAALATPSACDVDRAVLWRGGASEDLHLRDFAAAVRKTGADDSEGKRLHLHKCRIILEEAAQEEFVKAALTADEERSCEANTAERNSDSTPKVTGAQQQPALTTCLSSTPA